MSGTNSLPGICRCPAQFCATVTENMTQLQQWLHLSSHDTLTSLPCGSHRSDETWGLAQRLM